MGRHRLDRSGSGQGQVADTCKYGNEPSGSIKRGEFLDWLRTGQLLTKDSAPWSEYGVISITSGVFCLWALSKCKILFNNHCFYSHPFFMFYVGNHHHHHHICVMELGHLLTRSGLTYPQVSSKVYHDSFCQLVSNTTAHCFSTPGPCYQLYPAARVSPGICHFSFLSNFSLINVLQWKYSEEKKYS